jgi:hypothetical protein
MLRISGAVKVLEELLAEEKSGQSAAGETLPLASAKANDTHTTE